MSLLFMDSCDHYADADAGKKWTVKNTNMSLNATNAGALTWPGGGGVQVWAGAVASSGLQWTGGSNDATVVMGGWFYFTGVPTGVANFMMNATDAGTNQWDVRRDANNKLIFTRNGTTLATSTNTFLLNVWYFIEVKATTHLTLGVYEVRVNGSSVGWIPQATGAVTQNTAHAFTNSYFWCNTSQNGSATSCRGLYVLNTSGSVANDFVGVNMIRCLRPIAPGNYSQWLPNVGLNFSTVDDILGDGDLSFVTSATANQIDTFVYQDIPANGVVVAIQHVFESRQDGGAARTVAALQRSGSTDYPGASKVQAGSHVYYMDPQSTNPATLGQFLASEVNAAEFGYKLIS